MAVLALTSSGMGAVLPVSLRLSLFRLFSPFAEKLGLAYLYRSAKPLPFALMVARRRMGVKRHEMAMVGDQLYADRMAAALYGIPGLMVIPRGPDLGAQVVLKRKWEKKHWQAYYDRGGKTL